MNEEVLFKQFMQWLKSNNVELNKPAQAKKSVGMVYDEMRGNRSPIAQEEEEVTITNPPAIQGNTQINRGIGLMATQPQPERDSISYIADFIKTMHPSAIHGMKKEVTSKESEVGSIEDPQKKSSISDIINKMYPDRSPIVRRDVGSRDVEKVTSPAKPEVYEEEDEYEAMDFDESGGQADEVEEARAELARVREAHKKVKNTKAVLAAINNLNNAIARRSM